MLRLPLAVRRVGLVPFEAAARGTACLYSSRSSVAEYLPTEGALLDPADVGTSARRVAELLHNPERRTAVVDSIRRAGAGLTWDGAAAAYASVYRRAIQRPVGLSLAAGG